MKRPDFIVWLAGAILLAGAARADEVILRATARVAPGTAATLADVAKLSGASAEALGDTVIVPASQIGAGWTSVDLERVRAALEARGGVAWGLLSLRGSACAVGVAGAEGRWATEAGPRPRIVPTAAELGTGTVKGFIGAKIAAALGVEPSGLRLSFDPGDEDLLSMTTAGRTVEARITGASDRIPVRVAVFEGERLLGGRAVGVGALVQRSIAVATRPIRRGEVLDAGDLSTEDRWVGPSQGGVRAEDAVGAVAKAPLDAGQVVTTNDVESPVVIKRGDLVTVTSICGGVLVRATARARSGAKEGEMVVLETTEPDRKRRRAFTARAFGRGQAIITPDTNGTDEETTR
jgi:flagella basal body P-ring formation protein FlgA